MSDKRLKYKIVQKQTIIVEICQALKGKDFLIFILYNLNHISILNKRYEMYFCRCEIRNKMTAKMYDIILFL